MSNNHNRTNERDLLGEDYGIDGFIFSTEVIMSDNSHIRSRSTRRQQANRYPNPIFGLDADIILHNLQAHVSSLFKTKKKMALKLGWMVIFNTMGWLSLLANGVLAFVGSIDEVKQWVLLFFSCVFAGVKIWQLYHSTMIRKEESRKMKIDNDEREFQLKVAHDKYALKTQPRH